MEGKSHRRAPFIKMKLSQIKPPTGTFDPEEIQRLADSIKSQTLHHPIIIRADGEIIAGRKRFLAVQSLGYEEIEVKVEPLDISIERMQEISLHENLRRYNLPWYEQVVMEKELHDLRISQYGQRKSGRPWKREEHWSMLDTAEELRVSMGTLSQDLKLANALIINPGLSKVKDKKTALKLIQRATKKELAEYESLSSNDIQMDQIFLGDSLSILNQFSSESFNACVTDPPWSSFLDKSLTANPKDLLPIFKEIYRVLKRNSFLYIFLPLPDLITYREELPKFGFTVQDWPLIWIKGNCLTHGARDWQHIRDYELIMVTVKGSPILNANKETSSILNHNIVHHSKSIHPNEKPIELLEQLIEEVSFINGKILDPFAGSGSTLAACKKTGRKFIGIEKEKKFFELIERRLSNENFDRNNPT